MFLPFFLTVKGVALFVLALLCTAPSWSQKKVDTLFYDNNNSIRAIGPLFNEVKEGLWTFYHQDGAVESRGAYIKGEADGEWVYFLPDGTPSHKNFFREGVLLRKDSFLHKNGNTEILIIPKDSL